MTSHKKTAAIWRPGAHQTGFVSSLEQVGRIHKDGKHGARRAMALGSGPEQAGDRT